MRGQGNKMKLQILSHAGLAVEACGAQLVCDPWLVGSCYWRSWWNYPEVDSSLIDSLKPSFIYITHIHWDHFQGASLKRLGTHIPVIIPRDRTRRMYDDLKKIGCETVIELKHGGSMDLADGFRIWSYQFMPTMDSALVVEADGVTVLNVNDAKFMGLPLKQIVDRHGPFDFALRSHSSANARVCYRYLDAETPSPDEDDYYVQSFSQFMEAVRPRYAIPFASNCCHLHRDTFQYNSILTTPVRVAEYFEAYRSKNNLQTEIKVMVSGDYWEQETGFHISERDLFRDHVRQLAEYQERKSSVLNETYEKEDRLTVSANSLLRFFRKFWADVPYFLRRRLKDKPMLFVATAGNRKSCFLVDIYAKEVTELPESHCDDYPRQIVMPVAVLRKSLALNMFEHAWISKRVLCLANKDEMKYLERFVALLELYEYDFFPVRKLFTLRSLSVWARRWRELVFYLQALGSVLRGVPMRHLEARFLAGIRS